MGNGDHKGTSLRLAMISKTAYDKEACR